MRAFGVTDKGKVRKENQDRFLIEVLDERDSAVVVLCDGMGGAKSGNVASRLATEVFVGEIRRTARMDMEYEQIEQMMRDAVELANRAVFEQSKVSSDFEGMGTTLVAAFLTPEQAVIAVLVTMVLVLLLTVRVNSAWTGLSCGEQLYQALLVTGDLE